MSFIYKSLVRKHMHQGKNCYTPIGVVVLKGGVWHSCTNESSPLGLYDLISEEDSKRCGLQPDYSVTRRSYFLVSGGDVFGSSCSNDKSSLDMKVAGPRDLFRSKACFRCPSPLNLFLYASINTTVLSPVDAV